MRKLILAIFVLCAFSAKASAQIPARTGYGSGYYSPQQLQYMQQYNLQRAGMQQQYLRQYAVPYRVQSGVNSLYYQQAYNTQRALMQQQYRLGYAVPYRVQSGVNSLYYQQAYNIQRALMQRFYHIYRFGW